MNRSTSQGLLLTPEEVQRIQMFTNKSFSSLGKSRLKTKYKPEQYNFKPQINKQSSQLQRSLNDLYRWNYNKQQKIQNIYDQESRELYNNANRLTHQMTNVSVFDRLYQARKSKEIISSALSKRNSQNTNISKPYYTKNMTSSAYQEYKNQLTDSTLAKQKTFTTESRGPSSEKRSANHIYYDLEQLPLAATDPIKIQIPQYVELTDQIDNPIHEPEVSSKSPLHQKAIDVMVEKLNNWQAKKQNRTLTNQTKEQNLINNQYIFANTSQIQAQQYSNLFLQNNSD